MFQPGRAFSGGDAASPGSTHDTSAGSPQEGSTPASSPAEGSNPHVDEEVTTPRGAAAVLVRAYQRIAGKKEKKDRKCIYLVFDSSL